MTKGQFILLLTANFFGVALTIAAYNQSVLFWNCAGIALLLYTCRNLDYEACRGVVVVLGINMILMSLLYWGYLAKYNSPYFLGDSDDYNFDRYAMQVISEGLYTPQQIQNSANFMFHNGIGYVWYLSWIARISSLFGGYHPFIPRLLNIYYLSILCVLVYKYFQHHMGLPAVKGRLLIYWLGLFPNAVYVTIHNFRDVLSSLLLFVVFYLWDLFPQKKLLYKALIVIVTFFIVYWMYWIRAVTVSFIGIFVLVSLLIGNQTIKFNFRLLLAMAVVAITIVKVFNFTDFISTITEYNDKYNDYVLSISPGLSQTIFTMPILPFGIWLRILYGMFFPVPALPDMFDIDGFFQVLNSCGTIAQVLLLPYLFLNFKRIDKLVIVFVAMYIAILLTTFGFRHFIMLYPFMAIMIGRVYFKTKPVVHRQFLFIMAGLLVGLISIYLFLKA
jgi:hypothetical protein